MWLYVPELLAPETSSPCAAASEPSTTDYEWQCRALARSAWWRGKRSASRVWSARCAKESWLRALCGAMSPPSTAIPGVESWIRSLEASPASLQALPESEKEPMTSGGCGATSSASSEKSGPAGSSSKTSPVCSLHPEQGWGNLTAPTLFEAARWERFSGDWPRWGSLRNGAVFRRPPLDLRRGECGGSVWPTARTRDGDAVDQPRKRRGLVPSPFLGKAAEQWATPTASENSNRTTHNAPSHESGEHGATLAGQAGTWATPNVPNGGRKMSETDVTAKGKTKKGKRQVPLEAQTALWATPTTRDDARNSPSEEERKTPGLGRQAPQMTEGGKWFLPLTPNSPLRFRLSPRFVAWLMGIPWSLITPDGLSD